jgi:hypothetical protein
MELDQQPIDNGKLPNLCGKSIIFGPNIQWVGDDVSVAFLVKKRSLYREIGYIWRSR